MRVALLERAGSIAVEDQPEPEERPGHTIVKVASVGLCGSDLHWFSEGGIGDTKLEHPLVLGHEFSGVPLQGPLAGQLVAIDPAMPCEHCERCVEGNPNLCPTVRFAGHGDVGGGLREEVAWPTAQLLPVPEGMSSAAAALLEPMGVALHALDLGHFRLGHRVAVVGCGPIGLMLVELAVAGGAAEVVAVEPLEHRRAEATRRGAHLALHPSEAAGADFQADVALEVVGHANAMEVAMRLARPGARVVLVGIAAEDTTYFPASLARGKGLTVLVQHRMGAVYPRSIDLARRKVVDLDGLVTNRFGLEQVQAGFEFAVGRQGLKTVIDIAS